MKNIFFKMYEKFLSKKNYGAISRFFLRQKIRS